MKRIILEQKQTISINDIQTDQFYVIVKADNKLLNYTDKGLTYLFGGEPYRRKTTLEELIADGAEAYQFEELSEAREWIKENL